MTSLAKLFASKSKNILNIYTTAGFPNLNDTVSIMESIQNAGADIIELGMPYSDPLADGTIIQNSSAKALQNGMSISVLLEQMQNIRAKIQIPIVLMGYLNPLIQFGFENFCKELKRLEIDALIIPDIPLFEFENKYREILNKYNIDLVLLVTPQTSDERIKKIDELSSGFLYAVTSNSTTGSEQNFEEVKKYLLHLQTLNLKNPILAGFGIKDKSTFNEVATNCTGGIIGSAFIKAIENEDNPAANTYAYVESIIGGTQK